MFIAERAAIASALHRRLAIRDWLRLSSELHLSGETSVYQNFDLDASVALKRQNSEG